MPYIAAKMYRECTKTQERSLL